MDSTVGVGSVFWIELSSDRRTASCRRAQPNAARRSPGACRAGAPLRTLLYVEDNPANLKLVEQLIARRPDMRLLSAADGTSRHRDWRAPTGRK